MNKTNSLEADSCKTWTKSVAVHLQPARNLFAGFTCFGSGFESFPSAQLSLSHPTSPRQNRCPNPSPWPPGVPRRLASRPTRPSPRPRRGSSLGPRTRPGAPPPTRWDRRCECVHRRRTADAFFFIAALLFFSCCFSLLVRFSSAPSFHISQLQFCINTITSEVLILKLYVNQLHYISVQCQLLRHLPLLFMSHFLLFRFGIICHL